MRLLMYTRLHLVIGEYQGQQEPALCGRLNPLVADPVV